MLTRTLKKLENLGVVTRKEHMGPSLQVSYELTQSGRAVYEAVRLLNTWMAKHDLTLLKKT